MNKQSISTSQTILRLRNRLQGISNVSYTFSKLNQNYPIDTLNDEDGKEIIEVYKKLIEDTVKILKM